MLRFVGVVLSYYFYNNKNCRLLLDMNATRYSCADAACRDFTIVPYTDIIKGCLRALLMARRVDCIADCAISSFCLVMHWQQIRRVEGRPLI